MELSKKSWHFFIHRLMYGKYTSDPTNFCPYFWKSIVFGILFLIIFLPFALPVIIIGKVMETFTDDGPPSILDEGIFSFYLFVCFVVDTILLFVYSMLFMWFYSFVNTKNGLEPRLMHILGTIGWLVVTIFGVKLLIDYIIKKRSKDKPIIYHENKPNVFVEAVKTWYKRNCPMIKWK